MIYHDRLHLNCDEQTDLALYDAVIKNDLAQVRHLAQNTKRNLNDEFLVIRKKKHEFMNPIFLVSTCGHTQVLKFLIETGCDVNRISKRRKRSPVHLAVLNNNMSCLQLLITAHAKLDFRDVFGNSPSHYAAELGYHDMLDMMIRIGIQINSQDITAKTPLMKAVRNNRNEAVLRLIRANADLNITDRNNDIALHFAARNGNLEVVEALLSSGSLMDVQNLWGRSPLIEAVYYNNTDVVQGLLAAGCDLSKRECKSEETALQIAIRKKYPPVAEFILKYILSSPACTMTMLTTYDWDIHKYLHSINEHAGRKDTLFLVAAVDHNFKTCQLLSILGLIDYRVRQILEASYENSNTTESNRQIISGLLEDMKYVLPLKALCRNVIRHQLGIHLSDKTSKLPIPFTLKEYVLLKSDHVKLLEYQLL